VPLSSTAALEFVSNNESTNNLECLIGRKKAKMINSLNTKNNDWKKKIAVAHHNFANKTACQNNIFELEAKLLRKIANNGETNSQVKIMNQDLTNLDEDLKEFFKLKKKEILNNLGKQASSSTQ
jgi:kynureninase